MLPQGDEWLSGSISDEETHSHLGDTSKLGLGCGVIRMAGSATEMLPYSLVLVCI